VIASRVGDCFSGERVTRFLTFVEAKEFRNAPGVPASATRTDLRSLPSPVCVFRIPSESSRTHGSSELTLFRRCAISVGGRWPAFERSCRFTTETIEESEDTDPSDSSLHPQSRTDCAAPAQKRGDAGKTSGWDCAAIINGDPQRSTGNINFEKLIKDLTEMDVGAAMATAMGRMHFFRQGHARLPRALADRST
jgi:hypothetical protein